MEIRTFKLDTKLGTKWTAEAYNKPVGCGGRMYVVGEYDSEEAAKSAVAGLMLGYPREWTPCNRWL